MGIIVRRAAVPFVIIAAAVLVGVAACAAAGPTGPAGPVQGPETPAPVAITVNPSALPVGDPVPTGIAVGRQELVLYFWGTAEQPYLDQAWRDQGSGAVDVDHPCAGGRAVTAMTMGDLKGKLFGVTQCVTPDGTLIEFGGVWAEAGRITSQAGGATVEARYARWSRNPQVTIFWLSRKGKPLPDSVADGKGGTSPLPPENYPLLTAYDAKGTTIDSLRLRPPVIEPKSA
ncbi:hypothetical protein [Dactylosporangium sp. NPDC005555]|uniref:hypothetical protein n=1 Tax=Dactylosporangium sp. NPDC005555 TaxID=3154889 RepID=UPI0033A8A717